VALQSLGATAVRACHLSAATSCDCTMHTCVPAIYVCVVARLCIVTMIDFDRIQSAVHDIRPNVIIILDMTYYD
jgi:hypothetical protein